MRSLRTSRRFNSEGTLEIQWKYCTHRIEPRPSFWHSLRQAAVPSSTPISNLTKPKDESFRDHVSDEAEDSLLERWTKLGEAVLANGVPTEAHLAEMTALARSEQDQIKRKLRRTAKVYRQGQSRH